MHKYSLVITKEDLILEFSSYDNKIIEQEFEIWLNEAQEAFKDYIQQEQKQTRKIELGNIDLNKPPEKEPVKIPEPEPIQTFTPEPQKNEIKPEETQQPAYKISEKTKEILQRAIHRPAQNMEEALKPEPIEITNAVENTEQIKEEIEEQNLLQAPPQEDFTAIYNQKIVQENTSTDKFAQLLSLQNIHSKLDCLIACAYHLVERENFERFTLKQINTLSKALMEEAIEHDSVKEALEKRYIKIVPDYTGIATTMEYTLTEQGTRYFNDQIAE